MNKEFSKFYQMITTKFPPTEELKTLGFLSQPIESSDIREHLGNEMSEIYSDVQRGVLWVFMVNELSGKKIETPQGTAAFYASGNSSCSFILLDYFDKKNLTERFLSVGKQFNAKNNNPEMERSMNLWKIYFNKLNPPVNENIIDLWKNS
jgi:hypothetical protein